MQSSTFFCFFLNIAIWMSHFIFSENVTFYKLIGDFKYWRHLGKELSSKFPQIFRLFWKNMKSDEFWSVIYLISSYFLRLIYPVRFEKSSKSEWDGIVLFQGGLFFKPFYLKYLLLFIRHCNSFNDTKPKSFLSWQESLVLFKKR